MLTEEARSRAVRNVLLLEGASDVFFLIVKAVVGIHTGSMAVLGDAVHSFTDLANNVIGILLLRVAGAPPDREHPYGHHKYETLAVFTIAVVITSMAIQVGVQAIVRGEAEVARDTGSLVSMLAVLLVNLVFTIWERWQAHRLDSDLLRADANHTLSDVAVTVAVIAGWQFAAAGYPWVDSAFALLVSGFVFYLAFSLFRRSVPVLVDRMVIAPEELEAIIRPVAGVTAVKRIRSHQAGSAKSVEVVAAVDGNLPTAQSHAIADAIEAAVRRRVPDAEVHVHIEPDRR